MDIKMYIIIVILLTLFSCEEYLDTDPPSTITAKSFYNNFDEINSGIIGLYSSLNKRIGAVPTFAENMFLVLNAGTDEQITRPGFPKEEAAFGVAAYRKDLQLINRNWAWFYNGIYQSNLLLEKISTSKGLTMEEKDLFAGEVRFLRGFYYLYLTWLYGGVPIYETTNIDPYSKRNTIEDVFNFIITDMDFAYKNLPDRNLKKGYANKWSAAGYLVKIFTYLGSMKTFNKSSAEGINSFDWVDPEDAYTKAKLLAEKIIDESNFTLTKNYDYLFRETTKDAQFEECLFLILSSTDPINGNYNLWVNLLIPVGSRVRGGGAGRFRPTAEMYYMYDTIDFRKRNFSGTIGVNAQFELINGVKYYLPEDLYGMSDEIRNAKIKTTGQYSVGKFRHQETATKPIPRAWSQGHYPVLRYADILLLYAETIVLLNNDINTARDILTKVRSRITGNVDKLDSIYYRSNILNEIIEERKRELCFEGWRRIDLLRFGKMEEAINSLSTETGKWNNPSVSDLKKNWDAHKSWLPIPQTQIDLNKNLIQNLGY